VLHGSDDPAVPVAQAETLVRAVRNGGGTVEYERYDGEGHGWRRASTIEDELTRTERFLRTWVLER
jgi:dipeptidyl aminopeptidase/acylaminoacyl peptidase